MGGKERGREKVEERRREERGGTRCELDGEGKPGPLKRAGLDEVRSENIEQLKYQKI